MHGKLFYTALSLILLVVFGTSPVLAVAVLEEKRQEPLPVLLAQIKETVVVGKITRNTDIFDSYEQARIKIGEFNEGESVEIIRDRGFEWYLVKNMAGVKGWISVDSLWIPSDPETNLDWLPNFALEAYVNSRNLTSKTDQLVWVDLERQLTHVFVGQAGIWRLLRTMPCSTGKNTSPTLRGVHQIAERGDWFFTERLARGGKNWVQFSGPYLFHSLPMDKQGKVTDYTLLERRSAGCIRLSLEDSSWFYSFIKRHTTVFVN